MSLETVQPNSAVEKTKEKEPPSNWFVRSDIRGDKYTYAFSPKFIEKFGVNIAKLIMEYGDVVHQRNRGHNNGFPEPMDEETKLELEANNIEIRNTTGFTFQALMAKKRKLEGKMNNGEEELAV